MIETFPLVTISNLNTSYGIYKKNIFLTNSSIALDHNTLFFKRKSRKFSASISENSKKNNLGYFLEIIFHGLNYSAKRLKLKRKKFALDVHRSELFILNEPIKFNIKSRVYKRRLVFFSYDKQSLHEIEKTIKKFKIPSSYTGKGLFARSDRYRLKKGKKR